MSPTSSNLVVMFADISASTRLYDTLGNEEAQATIDRVLGIVRRICETGNGRVVKTIGDEVMQSPFVGHLLSSYADRSARAVIG